MSRVNVLSLTVLLVLSCQILANTCYCKTSGSITTCGNIPCGKPNPAGFVQCCGSGDTCGADGFCYFTGSSAGASGYYMGSCTDPAYRDSSCPLQCIDNIKHDVVYNTTSSHWACCFGKNLSVGCSNPGGATFEAPTPQRLFSAPFSVLTQDLSTSLTSVTGPTSSSFTAAATQTPTQSSLAASTNSAQPSATTKSAQSSSVSSSSSGLSAGAGVGIGIGIGVALATFILGAIAVVLTRSRRKSARESQALPTEEPQTPLSPTDASRTQSELESKSHPQEVAGVYTYHELGAQT